MSKELKNLEELVGKTIKSITHDDHNGSIDVVTIQTTDNADYDISARFDLLRDVALRFEKLNDTNETPEVKQDVKYDLSNIDWEMLKKQKDDLLFMIDDDGTNIQINQEHSEKLESLQGILHLIDSIQDHAVNVMGIPENEVFHLDEEETDEDIWNDKTHQKEISNVDHILFTLITIMGMDKPDNYDEILEFVMHDIMETTTPNSYSDADVTIAFRRWIENK